MSLLYLVRGRAVEAQAIYDDLIARGQAARLITTANGGVTVEIFGPQGSGKSQAAVKMYQHLCERGKSVRIEDADNMKLGSLAAEILIKTNQGNSPYA